MKLIHLKMLQGMTYSVHYQPFLHLSQDVNMMYCNILSLFRILPVEQYKRPWDPVSLTSTPRDTQVLGESQVGVGRDIDTSINIDILFQDMFSIQTNDLTKKIKNESTKLCLVNIKVLFTCKFGYKQLLIIKRNWTAQVDIQTS